MTGKTCRAAFRISEKTAGTERANKKIGKIKDVTQPMTWPSASGRGVDRRITLGIGGITIARRPMKLAKRDHEKIICTTVRRVANRRSPKKLMRKMGGK